MIFSVSCSTQSCLTCGEFLEFSCFISYLLSYFFTSASVSDIHGIQKKVRKQFQKHSSLDYPGSERQSRQDRGYDFYFDAVAEHNLTFLHHLITSVCARSPQWHSYVCAASGDCGIQNCQMHSELPLYHSELDSKLLHSKKTVNRPQV